MYLIALTGGIAAGKSTVAKHWVELGGIEIDADELAREAVAPGTQGLAAICSAFGTGLLVNGALDREKLRNIVFSEPLKLQQLNAIVHPIVKQLAIKKIESLPQDSMVIYNVPLLVEAQSTLDFDRVVTVEAPEPEQLRRLVSDRGLDAAVATAMIKSQASSAQRANIADYILNSNQPLELLIKDAGALWFKMQLEAEQKNKAQKVD